MASSISRRASHDRVRLVALWTGILAGPAVWLALLEFNYVFSYRSCETRQTWFLHLATFVAMALVVAAGVWAWRSGTRDPLTPDEPTPPLSEETSIQRVRWMAAASAGMTMGFVILIIATDIPVIVLKICQ